MILNDKKGWFGSFSAAGKGSAQKYNAFTKKNRRKKAKIYNPFDHHNLKEKAGDIEDNVDIFRINTLEIKSELKSDQNKKMINVYFLHSQQVKLDMACKKINYFIIINILKKEQLSKNSIHLHAQNITLGSILY